jgi:hypothetical protein
MNDHGVRVRIAREGHRARSRKEERDDRSEADRVTVQKQRLDSLIARRQYKQHQRKLILGVKACPLKGDGMSEAEPCEHTTKHARCYSISNGRLVLSNVDEKPQRKVWIEVGKKMMKTTVKYYALGIKVTGLEEHLLLTSAKNSDV